MKGLHIRKYSSPFSYMVCDLETSLQFIKTEFKDFLNVVSIPKHTFKWNGKRWNHHLFFNTMFKATEDAVDISKLKRICVWNHHNINDIAIINSIKRRCERLLMADKVSNVLYIYIDTIQTYKTDNWEDYYQKDTILDFIRMKKNRYILLLLPLTNFNSSPVLYNINKYLNVIFYKSNSEGDINDYSNPHIRWDLINNLVKKEYMFDIKEGEV
jgi:hypothetical protein